jgi:small-conductance mechanosensitive channel
VAPSLADGPKATTSMDIWQGIISPELVFVALRTLARLGLILLGTLLAVSFSDAFIEKLFNLSEEGKGYIDARRSKTLRTIIQSISRYVIYFIGGTMFLGELGIQTATILATAGIGGLAVGFGAQNLVKDVITGFFILFEDHFGVGDYVTIGGHSGVVEEMGLRVTKLRNFGGEMHIIPNGSIDQVTNHMGQSMRARVTVTIPYEENLDRAIGVLEELFANIQGDLPNLVEEPRVLGVSDLGERGVELTVMARTKPMNQWGMERELRRRIKDAFDAAGIVIPYPRHHLVIANKGEEE